MTAALEASRLPKGLTLQTVFVSVPIAHVLVGTTVDMALDDYVLAIRYGHTQATSYPITVSKASYAANAMPAVMQAQAMQKTMPGLFVDEAEKQGLTS